MPIHVNAPRSQRRPSPSHAGILFPTVCSWTLPSPSQNSSSELQRCHSRCTKRLKTGTGQRAQTLPNTGRKKNYKNSRQTGKSKHENYTKERFWHCCSGAGGRREAEEGSKPSLDCLEQPRGAEGMGGH